MGVALEGVSGLDPRILEPVILAMKQMIFLKVIEREYTAFDCWHISNVVKVVAQHCAMTLNKNCCQVVGTRFDISLHVFFYLYHSMPY